ncbi:MAG: DUF1206 domain-containing protein [Oceanicaulis sp.]
MEKRPRTSRTYEIAGRAGLFARAVVYALIAGLMLRAVFLSGSGGGAEGGQEGVRPSEAFQWLETEIYGQALLLAIGLGLALYALWRFVEAGADTGDEGDGAEGVLARAGMAASGAGYALVGVAAIAVLFGREQSGGGGGGGGATKTTVQWLLEQPFGPALAIVLGLGLAGIGCAQIWRAWKGEWKDDLDLSGWAGRTTGAITAAIGLRGLLFILVGVFVILAGWHVDPSEAKGLSGAITWLRQQPYGVFLYILGALALAGYGLYSFVQSRRLNFAPSRHA